MNISPAKLIVLLLLGLAACVSIGAFVYLVLGPSLGIGTQPDTGGAVFTQAALTLEVQLTQNSANATEIAGKVTPTFTPTLTPALLTDTPRPTNTPLSIASSTPIFTPTPIATAIRSPTLDTGGGSGVIISTPGVDCNRARFVDDVNFPDGTKVNPGESFTKKWLLQNSGTCTWTGGYTFMYIDGDQMSAPNRVPLGAEVKPGDQVEVAVPFIAPTISGAFESYWKLSDASGNLFGVGSEGKNSIWVRIEVKEVDSGMVFDFVSSACAARWETASGRLDCPGEDGDETGFVFATSSPRLEHRNEDEPALITHPEMKDGGFIAGYYPPIQIKKGDVFRADIGCAADSDKCNVLFQLNYRVVGGSIKKLGEWQEVYDGYISSILLDLSDLSGDTVEFILTVDSNGSANDDNAFWLVPQIERD